jgi:hypothetical protein
MLVALNDHTHYRTADICRMVGISRNTMFRPSKERILMDAEYLDGPGWKLLTLAQVEIIRIKTNNIAAIRQNS